MPNITTSSYTDRANEFIEQMGMRPDQYIKKFAKNSVIVVYAKLVDGRPVLAQEKFTDADPKLSVIDDK